MRSAQYLLPSILALLSACEEGGGPARFRVVNESAARVYLQVAPEGFWQLARAGQPLQGRDACGVCNCSDHDCAVCGAELGVLAPLEPKASHSWDWDGRIWKRGGQLNGHACERSELLSPGPATLSVFHGTKIREDGIGGQWFDVPPAPTSVDFDHAADVQVDVVIR
jgi:hypothetical protein